MFKNKSLLITGGTGSFGNAVLRRCLANDFREIRVFSRDEKKQDDMRKIYNNKKIKFYIGDIRDFQSVLNAVRGCDFIFHAAALKQVPSCEFFPLEAVKTNIIGTDNLLEAAIQSSVSRVIILSTDKAVYPINAMGISKAMMEKIAVAKSRTSNNTIINITRYGNVMCSRGSVIPLFTRQLLNNQPLTITDPAMTRFMMTLDDAVDLVMYAFANGKTGETFVRKAPAATIAILVEALTEVLGIRDRTINIIGTRHSEKLFEVLLSREEMFASEDLGDYYNVTPDLRDLNYENYIEQGKIEISKALEYNSHNTTRLDLIGTKNLLMKTRFIQATMRGEQIESEE